MTKTFLRNFCFALLAYLLLVAGPARATLVHIDGKAGGTTQNIAAGTYRASVIGGAWNAWGGQVGDGKGWLNNWGARLPNGANIGQGGGVYSTPISAFKGAQDVYFNVPRSGTMVYTNNDPKENLDDNVGGLTLSITKSLGSAKKDAWNLASDIAGFSANIAALVSLGIAGLAAAPVGAAAGALAALFALGLAGVGLAVLDTAGAGAKLFGVLANIKALAIDLVSAKYLGGALWTAGTKVSIFGIVASAVSLLALVHANDPPRFDYDKVSTMQAPPFTTGKPDDHFANSAVKVIDAAMVNIDSLEKYQGAVIDGNAHFAALQLKAYTDSTAAVKDGLEGLAQYQDEIVAEIGTAPFSNNTDIAADVKSKFASDPLPSEISKLLRELGLTENEFKNRAMDAVENSPRSVSSEEVVEFLGRGIEVPLTSVRDMDIPGAGQVPEPGSIFLVLLGILGIALRPRPK